MTAGQKLASESLDMLTPDEWQILFESGPTVAQYLGYDLAGITLPMLSDEDAQAIVDSLANNGVATFADAQNLQGVQIPPELQSLIDSITG